MKKILMSLAFASAVASATTLACAGGGTTQGNGTSLTVTTTANLGGLDTTGYVCGDKLFSNFNGTAPAGSIVITQITPDQYRIEYTPNGSFTNSAFTLNFTASVNTGTNVITTVIAQMFTSPLPNTSTATSTGSGGTSSNSALSGASNTIPGDDQTNLIGYAPGVSSTTISFAFTPGNAGLQTYEVNVFESPVPEPASLALLGSGLVGLGLVARRRKK